MSDTVSFLTRLSISARAIIWFALLLFGLIGFAVIYVLPWWMLAGLVVAGLVLAALPFALRWLFKRSDPAWGAKRSYLGYALGSVLLLSGLASLPAFYFAYWVESGPENIPLATLSNGKKTVVFQGMQHVGAEGFYKSVVFDLEKALADGYTLFYEGVQNAPGRPDIDDWFYKDFMGVKTGLDASYKQMADQCGMTFQLTYFDPLLKDKAIHPAKHITADVTTLDLRQEYDRLMQQDPDFAAFMNKPAAKKDELKSDPMITVLSGVGTATAQQKRLIGILCRGFIASAMGSEAKEIAPKEKLILLYRNKALARTVAESKADKIYITYGAKHFRGFIQDLKALDPAFEVVSLSWSRAMANPREANPPQDGLEFLGKPKTGTPETSSVVAH